jgi:hypothetical protein
LTNPSWSDIIKILQEGDTKNRKELIIMEKQVMWYMCDSDSTMVDIFSSREKALEAIRREVRRNYFFPEEQEKYDRVMEEIEKYGESEETEYFIARRTVDSYFD